MPAAGFSTGHIHKIPQKKRPQPVKLTAPAGIATKKGPALNGPTLFKSKY